MELNQYQTLADRTQRRDLPQRELLSMVGLGLSGEAGECSELVKKHLFHGHPLDREKVVKELGDVLWYLAAMAKLCDIPLSEVAETNITKLRARYPEGFTEEASRQRVE